MQAGSRGEGTPLLPIVDLAVFDAFAVWPTCPRKWQKELSVQGRLAALKGLTDPCPIEVVLWSSRCLLPLSLGVRVLLVAYGESFAKDASAFRGGR